MIKCVATINFDLKDFNELKNIVRKNPNKKENGKVYEGDTFECTEKMADYLGGNNDKNKTVMKIIEVIPEITKEVVEEVKEEKPKTTKKKKSSKK